MLTAQYWTCCSISQHDNTTRGPIFSESHDIWTSSFAAYKIRAWILNVSIPCYSFTLPYCALSWTGKERRYFQRVSVTLLTSTFPKEVSKDTAMLICHFAPIWLCALGTLSRCSTERKVTEAAGTGGSRALALLLGWHSTALPPSGRR